MGRRPALFQWKSGNVWWVVRGCDTVSCGDRQATAPRGNLPDGDGVELSRWLDVSRWCVRAVVQRIVGHRLGGEHDAAARGIGSQPCRMDEDITLARVSCSSSAGSGEPG